MIDVNRGLSRACSLTSYQIARRRFLIAAGMVSITGPLSQPALSSRQSLGAIEFQRYFTRDLYDAENLMVVQAIGWELSSVTAVPEHDLLVLADNLTISGLVSMPGRNITLVARKILVPPSGARIVTAGTKGVPSYENQIASLGQAGATDTGNGMAGGNISIYATLLAGTLILDTAGGPGGDAQGGGTGLPGPDGIPGTYESAPTTAGTGKMGGNAGRPGNGGDAGSILVSTEQSGSSVIMNALGGAAGKPGKHGDPGPPGARAGAARGVHWTIGRCWDEPR